ncbi:hypothetical protein [Dietzia kunjamensis]|uniref:hypothetical protein n=1 Tax=Dietzia kunjamensis TaxID=322509 RepID=UPI0039BC83C5
MVKFGKTMCQKCNNERTKKFDQAYDRFVEFLSDNFDYFRDKRQFSWGDIYTGYDFDQRHLQRYYLKNAGCRMIDAGVEHVPRELREYLYHLEAEPEFSLILYKDYESADLFNRMGELNSLTGASYEQSGDEPFMNPYAHYATANQAGELFQSGDELYSFLAVLQDGPIGGLFRWEHPKVRTNPLWSFNHHDVAFIRDRSEFDESFQSLLGGWDVYTDTTSAGLDMIRVQQEIKEHWKRKDSIEVGDSVRGAAWKLQGEQLRRKGQRAAREFQEAIERLKEHTGWIGQREYPI